MSVFGESLPQMTPLPPGATCPLNITQEQISSCLPSWLVNTWDSSLPREAGLDGTRGRI